MPSAFGKNPGGLRRERIKASSRFKDGAFVNTLPVASGLKKGTTFPVLGEFISGGQTRRPKGTLPLHDPRAVWATPVQTGLRVTWLGHSTVLLEFDGVRVLTDPVWGLRASPFRYAGPKRFVPAPVPIAALPPLDAVIVSHDHYDHLDYPSILELRTRDVPFVTSLGVGAHLEAWGVPAARITELEWWESVKVPGCELEITAAPSQHFSGRGMSNRNSTLWSSFVIQGPRKRVFFSGDTGLTPEYSDIAARLGPFDLVMLEVGAYHPAWGDIHLGPENALAALSLLGGGTLLPVHWGTFNLALHDWDEPAETLMTLAPQHHVHMVTPAMGQAIEPSRVEAPTPWWRGLP